MKKKFSVLLCTCIALSSISMPQTRLDAQVKEETTKIQETDASSSSLKEPEVNTLTAITSYVKSKIAIPISLTEFEYYYNSSSSLSAPEWNLTWRNSSNTERIIVTCDNNQNILSYRRWADKENAQNKPIYLKKELKTKADEFIKKTSPKIFNSIEYMDTSNPDIYSGTYSYCYRRVENGIPMPDNTLEVTINYQTGEVISLNTDWLYDVTIPTKDTKLTKEEAAKKMDSSMKMVLEYQSPYNNGEFNDSGEAYLVYHPDKSYLSVDAKTGEIYLSRNEISSDTTKEAASADRNAGMGSSKKDSGELTKGEIESISKLKHLISQKSAIQAIKDEKSLFLDESCTVIDASLKFVSNGYDEKNKEYVWDISFSAFKEPQDDSREIYIPYARASIDAKSGKILSYYASTPEYYNTNKDKWNNISVKYNLKECQPIFEAFAKKQIPEYFASAKLMDSSNDYIALYRSDKPIYGGYNYTFTRMNESVPYSSNGFSGSVDGVTGKIYRYSTNWNKNITFQSTKGIMSPSEAFEQYIAKDGYGLIYEINRIQNEKDGTQKNEVRLVYRADITPSFISPFSGKQLDYTGKVSNGTNRFYTYTDIDSSKNKRDILLLADLGIGFEGGKFNPSSNMTKGEFETMISSLRYDSNELNEKESTEKMTRTEAVKRLITYANLDRVAKLKNIFKTDFKDQQNIDSADLGYVSLAKGLGIISGDTFRGTDILTREEAAQMIISLLKSDY